VRGHWVNDKVIIGFFEGFAGSEHSEIPSGSAWDPTAFHRGFAPAVEHRSAASSSRGNGRAKVRPAC
jgi:hypothetical protein